MTAFGASAGSASSIECIASQINNSATTRNASQFPSVLRDDFTPPVRERRRGDQHPRDQPRDDAGPRFGARQVLFGDRRRDAERDGADGCDEEAEAEEEVEAAALGREADAGEQREQSAGEGAGRLQDELQVRQRVCRVRLRVREEDGERTAEHGEEQRLAEQPAVVRVARARASRSLSARMREPMRRCRPGSSSSTTIP